MKKEGNQIKEKADIRMAEVGESKTETGKTNKVLELEREKMRRAIIRELKKKLRSKGVEKVFLN